MPLHSPPLPIPTKTKSYPNIAQSQPITPYLLHLKKPPQCLVLFELTQALWLSILVYNVLHPHVHNL